MRSVIDDGLCVRLSRMDDKNSYWSSSYVHGSDNHEYLIISHVRAAPVLNVYRASILDITEPSYFSQFSTIYNASSQGNSTDLNFAFEDFSFALVGKDRLGSIATHSTHKDVQFNLTYDLSSPVLLNAGTGTFQWEVSSLYDTVVREWSVPAGKTYGTLKRGNRTIDIDTEKSLTWYDRQWEIGSSTNWTWFQLHLEKGRLKDTVSEKMSIWFYPSGFDNSTKGFATSRQTPGIQTVLPAVFKPGNRTFRSPFNYTYPLEWSIELLDGTTLNINTTRDDQELTDPQGRLRSYEGYVEVSGFTKSGESVYGYGLAEVQPILNT